MSKLMTSWLIALLCLFSLTIGAQNTDVATAQTAMAADSVANEEDDSLDASLEQAAVQQTDTLVAPMESGGLHQSLKTKFIEGNAGFMSLVALALVLGLAFCIERIIYLSLSEIKTKKFMADIDAASDYEYAMMKLPYEIAQALLGIIGSLALCFRGGLLDSFRRIMQD